MAPVPPRSRSSRIEEQLELSWTSKPVTIRDSVVGQFEEITSRSVPENMGRIRLYETTLYRQGLPS
jgi:hypothetical protein